MKIKTVTESALTFDNGEMITFDHCTDCCEWNYADFAQVDDVAKATEFNSPLCFEKVDETGFRFGNPGKMFFIPCYSSQNGYYSNDLQIYYNNKLVLDLEDLEVI